MERGPPGLSGTGGRGRWRADGSTCRVSGRTIIRNFWMLTIAGNISPAVGSQHQSTYTQNCACALAASRPANNVDGGVCTLPGSQGAETTLHACPRPQFRPIRGSTFHVTRRRWGPWWRPRLQSGWVMILPQVPRCVPSSRQPWYMGLLVRAVPLLIFRRALCPAIDGLHCLQRGMSLRRAGARGKVRESFCQSAEHGRCVGVGTRDPWRELGVSILDFVQETPQRVT